MRTKRRSAAMKSTTLGCIAAYAAQSSFGESVRDKSDPARRLATTITETSFGYDNTTKIDARADSVRKLAADPEEFSGSNAQAKTTTSQAKRITPEHGWSLFAPIFVLVFAVFVSVLYALFV